MIDPKGKYQYDALYRLLKATGRELAGLNAPTASRYTPDFVPTDGQSNQTLQTYCQQYTYDALGNILELSHRDTCGGTENWKRTYEYNTNKPNNYLQKAYTGSTPPSSPQFTYDAHSLSRDSGRNLLEMPHLNAMSWDFEDQLKTTEKTDETTYYVYAGGERVRKVCYNTATDKIKHERIYLGGYEIYREYDASGDLELERTSNHVMDDMNRVAILEVKTMDNGTAITPGNQVTIARYQYSNHLGSACLELNEAAEIISYQEYHPFGSTSYELHTNDSEVSLKRYQYVGKERDDESGLYYYGARYYAAWLCRFVSVDPLKDDYPYYTTYQYAGNKPVIYIDLDGLEEANLQEEELKTEPKQIVSGISHVDDFKPPIGSIDTRWGIKAGDYTLYGVTYYNNEGEVAGYYWIARLEDGEGKYQDDYIIGVEAVAEFIENAEEYSYLANVIDWAIALGGKRGGTKGQNLFEAWKSTWSIENILTGATIAGGGFVPLRPRPPMPRVKAFPR